MLFPIAEQEEQPMPSDQEPKAITIDADDFALLLAFVTFEIVSAIHPMESSTEETFQDIANRLSDKANGPVSEKHRLLLSALVKAFMKTEISGLG